MALGKYTKIGGAIKAIVGEYLKDDGVIYPATNNALKIGGAIKIIPIGDRYIYVCERTSDRVYQLTDELSVGWYYEPGLGDPNAVACDSSGKSYWACNDGVRAYDRDGFLLWTNTSITTVESICVDSDGNVYAGNYYGQIVKMNSVGATQWSTVIDVTYIILCMAVDQSAGILFVGTGFGRDAVYRLNTTSGDYTYVTLSCEEDVTSIAVDEDGYLYVGEGSGRIRKSRIDGYVPWTMTNIGADVHGLTISHGEYGYCALGAVKKVIKFALNDGGVEWTHTESACDTAQDCAVDISGDAYAVFVKDASSAENQVKRLAESDGAELDSWCPYLSARLYGVAVTPGLRAAGF